MLGTALLPLHETASIANCLLLVVTVKFDFKEIVGRKSIRLLLALVNANVYRIARLVLIHVIVAEVACCLCVLETHQIA